MQENDVGAADAAESWLQARHKSSLAKHPSLTPREREAMLIWEGQGSYTCPLTIAEAVAKEMGISLEEVSDLIANVLRKVNEGT